MIFPDKPRPPWQYAQPKTVNVRKVIESIKEKPKKESKPLSYYRDYVEFAVICVGFYFWVQYWIQFQ
jgi:hypothetical protein